MKKHQLSLEPKQSTIQKILIFSRSISTCKSSILKENIIYHSN